MNGSAIHLPSQPIHSSRPFSLAISPPNARILEAIKTAANARDVPYQSLITSRQPTKMLAWAIRLGSAAAGSNPAHTARDRCAALARTGRRRFI
jgi:hypothetical protein